MVPARRCAAGSNDDAYFSSGRALYRDEHCLAADHHRVSGDCNLVAEPFGVGAVDVLRRDIRHAEFLPPKL